MDKQEIINPFICYTNNFNESEIISEINDKYNIAVDEHYRKLTDEDS